MMRRLGLATLLLASSPASASFASEDHQRFCFDACLKSVAAVRFPTSENITDSFVAGCVGRLRLQSVYLCADSHCHPRRRDEGLRELNGTCQDLGVPIPGLEIIDHFEEEEIQGLQRFNATSPGRERALVKPALPTDEFLGLWIGTLDASAYVHFYHSTYGWVMGYFWAVVVAAGMFVQAMAYFENRRMHLSSTESYAWTWFKSNIKTPATFGLRHAQDYGGWATVPPLIQSVTIGLFAALNIFCSVHGYRFLPGNIYYPEISKQVLRHVSDRTGIISFANFPLIWLFGMRNNLVMWLTGWDFGTFNNFHRWIARIATLQAVIHSIGYTVLILQQGGWSYFTWWWTLMFWWAGELATILMCALLAFSFYWFRRSQYELFLLIHIGLSVLVLITMLGHVSIFNGEWDALVWVPAFIWAADRVIRVGRVVAFGWRVWDTQGQATFDLSSNMVRLEVPLSSSLYRVRPGTFFYLTTLDDTAFWESHPFTVALVSKPGRETDFFGEASPLLEASEPSLSGMDRKPTAECLTFLIRPYNSFTSRLKERAEAVWPKPAGVKMAVDGPYGRTLPLNLFTRIVFVVGGSGVVVPLSYMRMLLASSHCQLIEIHWSVREHTLAEEVIRKDLRKALEDEKVFLNIYLTGDSGPVESQERRLAAWHQQRMSATELIAKATTDSTGEGALAIVACGPARMADEARRASADAMGRIGTRKRIEYFEESFQW